MSLKKILIIGTFILICAGGLYQWGWRNDPNKLISRYQPTALNSHFTFALSSFSEYVKQTHTNIQKARTQAKVNNTSLVVAQNSPAELFPNPAICKKSAQDKYSRGVLLIHGLLASPYLMHALAEHFQEKCFLVYSIVLPGHGTVPGDLTQVTAEDWIKASQFGLDALAKQAKNIYIVGHSAGGTLAILAALKNSTKVKGLILFTPALKIASKFTWAITPMYWLSRILPRLQWISKVDDLDPVKYNSYPINAPYQTNRLIKQINLTSLPAALTLPIFIVQSAQDATIDANTVLDFFMKTQNPENKMLWFTQDPTKVTDPRITVIPSAILNQKILGQSHVSLALSEQDSYFGRQGSVKECDQYEKDTPQWHDCKTNPTIYLGETTGENLQMHTLRRITFDPFLAKIFQQIDKYLT